MLGIIPRFFCLYSLELHLCNFSFIQIDLISILNKSRLGEFVWIDLLIHETNGPDLSPSLRGPMTVRQLVLKLFICLPSYINHDESTCLIIGTESPQVVYSAIRFYEELISLLDNLLLYQLSLVLLDLQ